MTRIELVTEPREFHPRKLTSSPLLKNIASSSKRLRDSLLNANETLTKIGLRALLTQKLG